MLLVGDDCRGIMDERNLNASESFVAVVKGCKKEGDVHGESPLPSPHHAHHRRSRSASDKNFDAYRDGASPRRKEHKVSTASAMCYGSHSPRLEPLGYARKKVVSNHQASLENDIEQLQLRLQQEKSMRVTLERAMGRASSTLSPGHRHVATKTKELIAEIEALEEEVADKEKQVLLLYRAIFEQCISQPSSEKSSSVTSPVHARNMAARKHPMIISSSFCSSKKFPLRPLQALISDRVRGDLRTGNESPISHGKEVQLEKINSRYRKVPITERNSVIRTLKDHLHECPSKLSEEMVKCMAAVYCWLRTASSADTGKSPLFMRSPTNGILPRHSIQEENVCNLKAALQMSPISAEKGKFSHASLAINNYRILVEQLEKVNLRQMDEGSLTAFWINVYNALVMHAYLAYGIPSSSLKRLALFHKAAYNIGGHIISATAIEQSIFCFRTPRTGWWLETFVSAALRKRSGEERQALGLKYGLANPQPLVHFALCTGAISDPVLRVYTGSNIMSELAAAKGDFLQSNVLIKKSKVFLPKVLERFAKEAAISADDLPNWVIQNIVDKRLQAAIQRCIDRRSRRRTSQATEWSPYNSRFQYVFSKDLTDKP
ncbi:hypothetical protein MLD38_018395 [Melastoma candidum]|uniref:Uncharacterized protein n=1 Tax=Melastoma candidum TaxID=119954 RepID=A0ACB9QUZ9_9MYRT|nr:hypothetical protein MLD38_018395 [Melastoma candidum]